MKFLLMEVTQQKTHRCRNASFSLYGRYFFELLLLPFFKYLKIVCNIFKKGAKAPDDAA